MCDLSSNQVIATAKNSKRRDKVLFNHLCFGLLLRTVHTRRIYICNGNSIHYDSYYESLRDAHARNGTPAFTCFHVL